MLANRNLILKYHDMMSRVLISRIALCAIFCVYVQVLAIAQGFDLFEQFKDNQANTYLLPRSCNQVYEDSRGMVWMATDNGVVKYDGYLETKNLNEFKEKNLDFMLVAKGPKTQLPSLKIVQSPPPKA